MHQISNKKLIVCLVSLLIIVTCTSCKTDDPYLVKDYLNYLSIKTGIGDSENINDNFNNLVNWKVVLDSDKELLNNELDYAFLSKSICNLIDEHGNPMDILSDKGWIKITRESKKVSEQVAKEVIEKATDYINNREFSKKYEFEYTNNVKADINDLNNNDIYYDKENNEYLKIIETDNGYKEEPAEFEDVFSYLNIEDTYEIDFNEAEIIPLQEEEKTGYVNNKFNLLSSKSHVFNKDGFRISYSVNSSGIDVHVSKKVDKVTVYGDASINSVKPSLKWLYEKGDLKNCYFNVKMNTTSTLGATMGRFANYYLKLKDKDSKSFMDAIKSMVVPKKDYVEAIIPICQIKTPIADIPYVNLNMTIGIKLYASGTVELILYNSHNIGFEVKEGNARFFYEHNDDVDAIVKASGKSAIALNVGVDASKFRLCDVELDGGVKAEVRSTVHLYDTDFNESEEKSDIEYSDLQELSKDNPYVQVCGDVSLYWLVDLLCNTSKSVMYKMGLSKTFHILDEDNQIFGNMHHIEDGHFVKSCTRKKKAAISNQAININTSNKIVLNTYAEVLLVNDLYKIELLSLPTGYSEEDIRYTSSDKTVATVENGQIRALKPGSSKINVHTSDNKYNTYINILVSTG